MAFDPALGRKNIELAFGAAIRRVLEVNDIPEYGSTVMREVILREMNVLKRYALEQWDHAQSAAGTSSGTTRPASEHSGD